MKTLADLLRKRVLFVVGKGGVGKSTVATALGLAAARRGRRVLLVQMEATERLAQLFSVRMGGEPGPRELSSNLSLLRIDGMSALTEYLGLVIRVRRVLRMVVESRLYRYFVAAAPGLKELMTVGKVWYEQERRDPTGGGFFWDLVIVDSPATGHSLQYLRMPRAAEEAFGPGLVRREAKKVADLLSDPARTVVCLVTTAEEMPVAETIEMYEQLCHLRLPLGILFVNRLHERVVASAEVQQWLVSLEEAKPAVRSLVEEILRCAREEALWAETNEACLERLAARVPLPVVKLPFLFTEEFGLEQVEVLRELIERQLGVRVIGTGKTAEYRWI